MAMLVYVTCGYYAQGVRLGHESDRDPTVSTPPLEHGARVQISPSRNYGPLK